MPAGRLTCMARGVLLFLAFIAVAIGVGGDGPPPCSLDDCPDSDGSRNHSSTCDSERVCVGGICRRPEGPGAYPLLHVELVAHATRPPSQVAALVRVSQDGLPRGGLGLAMFDVREDGLPLPDDSALRLATAGAVERAVLFAFHRSRALERAYNANDGDWQAAFAATFDRLRVDWGEGAAPPHVELCTFGGHPPGLQCFWNATAGESLPPRTLPVSTAPVPAAVDLHTALVEAAARLSAAAAHVRALVLWTDDVDRAERVTAAVAARALADAQVWVHLLDLDARGQALPHAWGAPSAPADPGPPPLLLERMAATSTAALGLFWENARARVRTLSSDLYALAYCSPSRGGRERAVSIVLTGGGDVRATFALDARGFEDAECPGAHALPRLDVLDDPRRRVPPCARGRDWDAENAAARARYAEDDADTIRTVLVATIVTIAGLFLIYLVVALVLDYKRHGGWSLVPAA